MWRGTAESYTDMNPPGVGASQMYATCGSAQAGYGYLPGSGITAGIWFGTPESSVPIGSLLPAGYYQSVATSIAEENGVFYVGGYARNSATGQDEAFLWTGAPAPATLASLAVAAAVASRRRR